MSLEKKIENNTNCMKFNGFSILVSRKEKNTYFSKCFDDSCEKKPIEKEIIYDDFNETIENISEIIYEDLLEDIEKTCDFQFLLNLKRFDEEFYMSISEKKLTEKNKESLRNLPNGQEIFIFIKGIAEKIELGVNEIISAYVYFNRFIKYNKYVLTSTNWRLLLLICLNTSAKYYHDFKFKNITTQSCYPLLNIYEFNNLEFDFIIYLKFNTHVSKKIITEYYLSLTKPKVNQTYY